MGLMIGTRMTFYEHIPGRVFFHEYNWGPRVLIVHVNEETNHMILKVPSHTRWSGMGQTTFEPTIWMLTKLVEGHLKRGTIVLLANCAPGHGWRKVRKEYMEIADGKR